MTVTQPIDSAAAGDQTHGYWVASPMPYMH